MQQGLSEVAADVEADPGAVFEAHGAESVEELVTEEGATERDEASDRAVSRLFEEDLSRPERRSTAGGEPTRQSETGESTTTPAVLADLERAIEVTDGADPTDLEDVELAELDDADVAAALAAAEELDGNGTAPSVPAEWTDQ